MKKLTLNLHFIKNDIDVIGKEVPLQTFVGDDVNKILREIKRVLENPYANINQIVIFNHKFDIQKLKEADAGKDILDADLIN